MIRPSDDSAAAGCVGGWVCLLVTDHSVCDNQRLIRMGLFSLDCPTNQPLFYSHRPTQVTDALFCRVVNEQRPPVATAAD